MLQQLNYQQQQQLARDVHTLANYQVRQPGGIGLALVLGFLAMPFLGLAIGLLSAARKALGW